MVDRRGDSKAGAYDVFAPASRGVVGVHTVVRAWPGEGIVIRACSIRRLVTAMKVILRRDRRVVIECMYREV